MVAEFGNVLDKALTYIGRLFQRMGAIWLNEGIDILREDVEGSRLR